MIESIIKNIEQRIEKDNKVFNYISLSNGVLGMSLFYYYHYLYSNNKESYYNIIKYLEKALEMLHKDYISYSVSLELLELGNYLIFLIDNNIIDEEETSSSLAVIDDYLISACYEQIEIKNLDNVKGIVAFGNYFIKREHKEANKKILIDIINCIEKSSCSFKGGVYWEFDFRKREKPYVELGLVHGMLGIVSFLSLAYKKKCNDNKCKILIENSLDFLLKQKIIGTFNLFPINAFDNEVFGYSNLNYGDIGIAYVFLKVGKLLDNMRYVDEAKCILDNLLMYRSNYVDANLLYGSAGVSSVFREFYLETNDDKFLNEANHWYLDIVNKRNTNLFWEGFSSQYFSELSNVQLGFSHGLIGIGIALMAKELNQDYLKFLNYEL